MRRLSFSSLRVRMTALILLVVVPLMMAAVLFSGFRVNQIIRQNIEQQLTLTASSLAENVFRWETEYTLVLKNMSVQPAIVSMDAAQQKPVLAQMASVYESLYLIHTTDLDGINVARNDDKEPKDYHDQPWFLGAVAGNDMIRQTLVSRTTNEPSVCFSTPIWGKQAEIQGVAGLCTDLTVLTDQVGATRLGQTGFAFLVDDQGQVLAYPDPAFFAELKDLSAYPPVQRMLEGQSGPLSFNDEEGASWLAHTILLDSGWGVVIQQQESEILVQATAFWQLVMAIALLAVLALGILTWLVTSRLVRPITDLTAAATALSAGDLEQTVTVERKDELGALASAFNSTSARLREMIGTLETRGRELEARTRELEASQRVTFAVSERTSPDELLNLVVNLIRDQFHLYHVQVYIVNEEEQAAVLRQSTGFAGRRLLQRKHRIPLDRPALVTKAIHEGEPMVVDDVSADPNFMPNPLLPDTRSELVIPLKTGDRVIGALDAQDRAAGRFTPNIVTLFQAMADQAAFLFENSDLMERVTEHSRALTIFTDQLRTAADIARRLGATLDPERLLQQVVDLIRNRFGIYHVHIYVLEAPQAGRTEKRRLVVRAGSGDVGRVLRERGHSIPLDYQKSFVARAARTQETVLVTDTTVESDFVPNPLLPQTRSEMVVPLIAGGEVLGVLDVQDDQPGRFTQAELDTFSTLAGQIATALQTADLFGQIQARLRVSQALAGAQTEEDVLDAMMAAADLYPQAQVAISLYDQEAGEPTLVTRRVSSFESDVALVEIGTRFLASRFRIMDHLTPDEPLVISNLPTDERIDPATRQFLAGIGAISTAISTIAVGDEQIGVLWAISLEERYFDERKLHLYQSIAEQGAIALRTGRLFDETQRAAEELREMDRLKSEFLANMSHELRTPLNSIIGYTEIMLMGISEIDPDTLEDVQAIHTNGRHLLGMIDDILDMAKIEAGSLTLNFEENHVDSLVDDVSSAAARLLAGKSIELIVDVEEDIPPIWGDRMRLDQIFNNLVSNAGKFTEEGSIILRAYTDRGDGSDGGWVCIEIKDTGMGISETDVERIFDRFQQVDGSSTRRAGGTGLGLAITHHMVRLHGGTIQVESQPGEGSTFTVRLPVQRREDTRAIAGS